ncbi:MAG TPA: winged helix-turn-helix transcriptional regulator [Nitrososphaerales archaeon]|nr:winged helix-turn-helix transcriptional regulator [Nitrososphaerales archaeon]
MNPDEIDARILEALMDDGRASLRQIARMTSLTTPTVSARMARMLKAGMIKKFVPILSPDSLSRRISAMISLKVTSSSADKLASDLSKLPEVENLYITTGQGITLKVALEDVGGLHAFLRRSALARPGVSVASSQIITSVVKEEPAPFSPAALKMNLKCDYCHEDVARARPYIVAAGSSRYYFCCKTCKAAYLDKYGSRLTKATKQGLQS